MDRRARDEATGRNYPRQVPDVVTWTIAQLTDWVNAVIGETLGGGRTAEESDVEFASSHGARSVIMDADAVY